MNDGWNSGPDCFLHDFMGIQGAAVVGQAHSCDRNWSSALGVNYVSNWFSRRIIVDDVTSLDRNVFSSVLVLALHRASLAACLILSTCWPCGCLWLHGPLL